MTTWRRLGPLGLLLAGLALSANAQDACSGHGQLVDGKCACDTPLPVDATPGWVGKACNVPVHRIFLDAQDIQATCGEGRVCNVVAPSEPVCFATPIAEMADTAFHLSIVLASNSVDAAVALRGLLTNFTATVVDPATNATKVVPQAYPTEAAAFSFSVHTSHDSPSAQLQLSRRQLGYGAYTGMYLCAESTASTTFVLRGATSTCPFSLQPSGELQLCSGRGATDTCPHGTCACAAQYVPPPNWLMTPGLGFEDCSATLQPLQPTASPPAPASLSVAALAPGAWSFFGVEVPDAGAFELRVAAAATEATKGSLALYLRHQQLPSEAEGQHDLASDVPPPSSAGTPPASSSWWRDLSVHATLRRTDAAFRPGTWYLGVYNKGAGPVSYNITAALNGCPNDCSGRGTCDAASATCTCSQPSMLPPDCSVSSYELALGQPLTAEPRAFAYDRLVLRGVGSQLRSAATSRLAVTASFTTSDADPPGLPDWVTGRPVVIVAPSADAAANATAGGGGSSGSPLWPDGAAARMALSARGVQYSMDVGPWMISPADDSLHLLVWNPLSGPPRLVGYTLTVAVVGSCLADCSGHGTCDTATGLCACQAPFAGGDCSVDLSQYNTTGGACAAGALRPVRREESRGTCWQACKPDGSGFDEGRCEQFTCDGPAEGHGQLRRKGGEEACVEDGCVAGNYTVTDPSGYFTCTRRCACPEDGGACGLEADCLPGSVQCLKGLALSAATGRCVEPPCPEGSLRRAYELDGGAAFAVCACGTPGDPVSCAFTTPTAAGGNAGGVVACQPGYERQGDTSSTRLSDGSALTTGGSCVAASQAGRRRHGVSGGMVFFYCLLSIALAAGLVVGGKYGLLWYEQYRYGRSVFSQVSWPLLGTRTYASNGVDDW